MYRIVDHADHDAGIKSYVVDTYEEISTLSGDMGSEAYCLEDSRTYIKDGDGQWIIKLSDGYGVPGVPGVGIEDIEKTNTEGLVDTYTITLTNEKTKDFTVTNGKTPVKGKDYLTEEELADLSAKFVKYRNTSGRYAYMGESGVDKVMPIVERMSSAPAYVHIPCRTKYGTLQAGDAREEDDTDRKSVV